MNTHKTWPLAFKIKLRISKVERHPKEADKRLKRSVWITATPPARLVRSGRWRKENPGGRASTEGTQSPAESQASVITKKPMFSVIIKSWQIKASLASERTLVLCGSPDINSIPTERTGDRSRRITPFHSNSNSDRPGDKQPLPAGAMEGLKCEEPSRWVTGLKWFKAI